MRIVYTKHFEKKLSKLDKKIKEAFKKRVLLFSEFPFSTELNNHSLQGEYMGYRSINITGDVRAIFKYRNDEVVKFEYIGTHSDLYK